MPEQRGTPLFELTTNPSNPSLVLLERPAMSKVRSVEDLHGISGKKTASGSGVFADRYRYLILFIGALCLTMVCSNMIALNFTLICMNENGETVDHGANSTELPIAPKYHYSTHEKSILLWAVAFGCMAATFPFNSLYALYGAKWVFFAAGILSAVSTLVIPLTAEHSFTWFVVARVVQGIAYASDFAAIGVICARWASLKQNGIFLAVLTSFTGFSSALTNSVSGLLCESSWGWPSVYYVHGIVSLIAFSLWILCYQDQPEFHKSVSAVELEKIHRGKSEAHKNMDSFIPYWKICSNKVVLIIWLNALADIGSGIFLLTYTPIYMKSVLRFSVTETGFLGALPALATLPFKFVTGYLSDKMKNYNERYKMMFFNTLALGTAGLLYAILGFVPDDHPVVAVVVFMCIHVFLSGNCAGFYKCAILVARQYSAFVVSNIQFIKCVSLFIAPGMVSLFITDEESKAQWRLIFFVWTAILFVANIAFCFVATDEPADFTLITRETAREKSNGDIELHARGRRDH
uniref:MFS domain-containing protein n=1 Tax=Panagrellus redivivus TaxID=6233 RepID=A0A7E4VI38_PANRE